MDTSYIDLEQIKKLNTFLDKVLSETITPFEKDEYERLCEVFLAFQPYS